MGTCLKYFSKDITGKFTLQLQTSLELFLVTPRRYSVLLVKRFDTGVVSAASLWPVNSTF